MGKLTIGLDFDGVLNSYKSGWITVVDLPDDPVEGAVEWCWEAQQEFKLVVFSSRGKTIQGRKAMEKWLSKHGFPKMDIVSNKPQAIMLIDDRGYHFTGKFPSVEEMKNFKPWWKK